MSTQIYQGLHNVSWYCDICGLPNFSSCFIDNTSFVNTNMFEPLSRQDQNKTNCSNAKNASVNANIQQPKSIKQFSCKY